jgi:hypothetical protein
MQGDLAGLKKPNHLICDANRNGRLAKTGKASYGLGLIRLAIDEILLNSEAGGATPARVGHKGAKGTLMLFALKGVTPHLMGPKRQRQTGCLIEGSLVIAENLRF